MSSRKAKVPDSRCGDEQRVEERTEYVHGCLVGRPAALASRASRPESPFVPHECSWFIADDKSVEVCSESPPMEGPSLACDIQRFPYAEVSVF